MRIERADGHAQHEKAPIHSRLTADRRGAVYVEFLVIIIPLLTFFCCLVQLADMQAAKLIVHHAAYRAARAAVVIYPDDPKHNEGPTRRSEVEAAAKRVLYAKKQLSAAEVDFGAEPGAPSPGDRVDMRVSATYTCHWPIANHIVCGLGTGTSRLEASVTMPYQAARYAYE